MVTKHIQKTYVCVLSVAMETQAKLMKMLFSLDFNVFLLFCSFDKNSISHHTRTNTKLQL